MHKQIYIYIYIYLERERERERERSVKILWKIQRYNIWISTIQVKKEQLSKIYIYFHQSVVPALYC